MSRHYPTREGVPISPHELGMPPSTLDLESKFNINNHHGSYYKRAYGGVALFSTFRNLENNQYVLGLDQHSWIHRRFTDPEMPTPKQALDRIDYGFQTGERLKTGSVNRHSHSAITNRVMRAVKLSYEELL